VNVPPPELVSDDVLEASSVVANTMMNRERQLIGVNSYERELGVDPAEAIMGLLSARDGSAPTVGWIDLCCGRGRALVDAADRLTGAVGAGRVSLVGLDLVDHFQPEIHSTSGVSVHVASLTEWEPDRLFDLITCVHGLHYVGDKLGAIVRVASWLSSTGRFVASFDLAGFRWADGSSASRSVGTALRRQGFDVDTRRHLISLNGGRPVAFPFTYLGADPNDGPNYTGQPAVASFYARPDGKPGPPAGRQGGLSFANAPFRRARTDGRT
jgi:SAM-dependent methyltransferase